MDAKTASLFFEQIIERLAHVVTIGGLRTATSGKRHAIVRLEIVAEVRPVFFTHQFGLRLAALIVFAGVEVTAVFAAMDVGVAMRALILSHDFSDDFDFTSAVVANHNFPSGPAGKQSASFLCQLSTFQLKKDGLIKSRMCRMLISRLRFDGSTARKQATRSVTK